MASPLSRFLTFSLAFVLLATFPLRSHAESFDDASIRAVYAEEFKLGDDKDTTKIEAFLKARLADNYTITTETSDIVNGAPPQSGKESYNKAQTIANAVDNAKLTNTERSEDNVKDIKYSDDRSYAYVTTASTSSGTMSGPDANGHPLTLHFDDELNCVDKVILTETIIEILQSSCNDRLIAKE